MKLELVELALNTEECYSNIIFMNNVIDYSGIYAIKNILNDKIYIGSSCQIHVRLTAHLADLRHNHHCNQKLQNAWNKYGEENFKLQLIEFVLNETDFILPNREQHWIDHFNSVENGYNIQKFAYSAKGLVHTEETKLKISKSKKGIKRSLESLKNAHDARRGVPTSELQKEIASKTHRGEGNYAAVLKENEVKIIKQMLFDNFSVYMISKKFNVSENIIRFIKYNRTWKHIPWPNKKAA